MNHKILTRLLSIVIILITNNIIFSETIPFTLDHNRMIIDAEIQLTGGNWRKVKLWVDSGNPEFFISPKLAQELGINLDEIAERITNGSVEVEPIIKIKINDMILNFDHVSKKVVFQPDWLFSTMHNDANLPSTVLMNYDIVFDYPNSELTIAEAGKINHIGNKIPVEIHPKTGIVQLTSLVSNKIVSFALDNGASYSFASEKFINNQIVNDPIIPKMIGTISYANMWGWWPPNEENLTVTRLSKIKIGNVLLKNVGMVSVPRFSTNGPSLGEWYSHKTLKPVVGFLGTNAIRSYRVGIDYINQIVYFDNFLINCENEMDIVGLTLQPQVNGSYKIIGISNSSANQPLDNIEVGDIIIQIDDLIIHNVTMGVVIDALRGYPGDMHTLVIERNNKMIKLDVVVNRYLEP